MPCGSPFRAQVVKQNYLFYERMKKLSLNGYPAPPLSNRLDFANCVICSIVKGLMKIANHSRGSWTCRRSMDGTLIHMGPHCQQFKVGSQIS